MNKLWEKRVALANKLGLTLIVDTNKATRFPPQYIISDTVPADHIKFLPRSGHWRVCR